jgi:RimJ/RimL family protein N-acetyltransferase
LTLPSFTSPKRVFDAQPVNELCNSPDVRPYLGGFLDEPVDLTNVISNTNNVVLEMDGFVGIYVAIQPGLFEVHTQASKDARDAGLVLPAAKASLEHMFLKTNCIEVITRVPKANKAARALVQATGFKLQFEVAQGWQVNGEVMPCDIYAISLTDWLNIGEHLETYGKEFHEHVVAACEKAGVERAEHPDDAVHERMAGAAYMMIRHGHVGKAVLSYNRWAAMAGYMPISPVSLTPMIIHIGDMALLVRDDGSLEVVKCQ